ncbi:hypothetical protein QZH41_003420 [Actinostola sp. cb2023]|nr:hypothetical protein QZH41_003420 [Actinostola sp. cb2023]
MTLFLASLLPCFLASWLPGFLASWLPGFLASWLPGFLASWLPGFLASWLPGFLASWLPGFLASWLPGFLASWLPGFLASWLPGFLASWLPGFLASWLPGFLASWLPGFLASLLPCFLASLLPCFLASLLPCFLATSRRADTQDSNYKTAVSVVSNLGNLMKDLLTTVDTSSAVTLSITNNCANCELSEPMWYTMKGTMMDGPPPLSLKKEETMIIIFKGTSIPGKTIDKNSSHGGGGTQRVIDGEIKDTDPFPSKDFNNAFAGFKAQAHVADQYGSWQTKPNGDTKLVYSMGGANKTPFQIFIA